MGSRSLNWAREHEMSVQRWAVMIHVGFVLHGLIHLLACFLLFYYVKMLGDQEYIRVCNCGFSCRCD